METLGQSEPYFVKCIRSNAEKVHLHSRTSTSRYYENRKVFIFLLFLPVSCPWDLMTLWCWGSFATQACWRLCASDNPATASNIPFRYACTHTCAHTESIKHSQNNLEVGLDFSSFVEGCINFRSFPVFGHNHGIQGWNHSFQFVVCCA